MVEPDELNPFIKLNFVFLTALKAEAVPIIDRFGLVKNSKTHLYQNNKMKADAKQNVNQQLIDINVGAAADQSMMARDARRAESQGMQQAVDGLGAVAGAASDLIKPFSMRL